MDPSPTIVQEFLDTNSTRSEFVKLRQSFALLTKYIHALYPTSDSQTRPSAAIEFLGPNCREFEIVSDTLLGGLGYSNLYLSEPWMIEL